MCAVSFLPPAWERARGFSPFAHPGRKETAAKISQKRSTLTTPFKSGHSFAGPPIVLTFNVSYVEGGGVLALAQGGALY